MPTILQRMTDDPHNRRVRRARLPLCPRPVGRLWVQGMLCPGKLFSCGALLSSFSLRSCAAAAAADSRRRRRAQFKVIVVSSVFDGQGLLASPPLPFITQPPLYYIPCSPPPRTF